MHTLSFISASGGVGKTTFAILTAGALAARGKRVLLIDLDSSATATLWTVKNVEENCDIKTLMKELLDYRLGRTRNIRDVRQCLHKHKVRGLDAVFYILPGGNLNDLTMEIFSTPKWEILLDELIAPIKEDFDYIIVDSPNWLYPHFPMVVMFTPFYIALTRPGGPEREKTALLLDRIFAMLKRHFSIPEPEKYVAVLLNQIRTTDVADIEREWNTLYKTLAERYPGITVIRNDKADYYYGKTPTPFYGFKLRNDLGAEEYQERGHPLRSSDKAIKAQFTAYIESLTEFIKANAPYQVE